MMSQWKPLPQQKKMSLPGGATPANFIDRFREMNSQEQLIELKKKEIELKEAEKKQQDLKAAAAGDAAAAKKLTGYVSNLSCSLSNHYYISCSFLAQNSVCKCGCVWTSVLMLTRVKRIVTAAHRDL